MLAKWSMTIKNGKKKRKKKRKRKDLKTTEGGKADRSHTKKLSSTFNMFTVSLWARGAKRLTCV